MKFWRSRKIALPAMAAAILAAGCSRENTTSTAEASFEVQGELISAPSAETAEPREILAETAPTDPVSPNLSEPSEPRAVAKESLTPPTLEPAAENRRPTAKTAQATPVRGADGFIQVSFEKLAAFEYDVPEVVITGEAGADENDAARIPDDVKALDKERVALQGFMLPLKIEGGLVTEMLIMRDQSMCCYGTVPRINEWVSVKMTNKGVRPVMDQAVTLFGRLHVGEMRENGYLVGIYQMDGERLAGPQDL